MIKKQRQKNNTIISLSVVYVCLSILAACKKDTPPPVAAPAPAPTAAAVPAPKPVLKAVSSAVQPPAPPSNQFDFSGKKDPFKPYVAVKPNPLTTPEMAKKAQRDALPILNYDVNQFRLIGIITGGKQNQAMVTDPSGKGYVLKLGMTIGNRDGKVSSITSAGVNVTETTIDDNGKPHSEIFTLTLPRKQ